MTQKAVQKSPKRVRQFVFAFGWGNTIVQEVEQRDGGIGLGTPIDARRAPDFSDGRTQPFLVSRDGFILDSTSGLLVDETVRLRFKTDYEQAFGYIEREPRGAASVFTRAFGPVVQNIRDKGDSEDADQLQFQIERLSRLGADGTSREDVSDAISSVHRVLHEYFQNHRT